MQMKIKTTITYSEIEKALLTSFREALEKTAEFLEQCFRERLQVRYYSLKELKKMGHPYARRHYSFEGIGSANLERYALSLKFRKGFRNVRLDIINRQSGELEDSLKSEVHFSPTGMSRARVYIDTTKVPYAPFVFWGTSKMIPRPIHLLVKAESEKDAIATFRRVFAYKFYLRARRLRKKIVQQSRR